MLEYLHTRIYPKSLLDVCFFLLETITTRIVRSICKSLSTVILATESPELLSAASTLYIPGGPIPLVLTSKSRGTQRPKGVFTMPIILTKWLSLKSNYSSHTAYDPDFKRFSRKKHTHTMLLAASIPKKTCHLSKVGKKFLSTFHPFNRVHREVFQAAGREP